MKNKVLFKPIAEYVLKHLGIDFDLSKIDDEIEIEIIDFKPKINKKYKDIIDKFNKDIIDLKNKGENIIEISQDARAILKLKDLLYDMQNININKPENIENIQIKIEQPQLQTQQLNRPKINSGKTDFIDNIIKVGQEEAIIINNKLKSGQI